MEAILVNDFDKFPEFPNLNDQGIKLMQNQETQTEIEEQKQNILKDISTNVQLKENEEKKGPSTR